MRTTINTFPMALTPQIADLTTRQARLQSQAATGQRVQLPSDDPDAVRNVLQMQNESRSIDQFQDNIASQRETANVSYGVMKGLKKISDRATEIATLANSINSQKDLDVYATEVNQMIQQAAQLLNTSHNGSYLFAGTNNDQPPYTITNDADGLPVSVAYGGNTDLVTSEIAPQVATSGGTVGENTDGSGPRGLTKDTRSGADLFGHLISLAKNLRSGDKAAIVADDQVNLKKDEENIIYHYGFNGASQARLDAAESSHKDRSLALETQVSGRVDADLAQTLVHLNETQNAYKAALQSAGTILNVSLLDYLH